MEFHTFLLFIVAYIAFSLCDSSYSLVVRYYLEDDDSSTFDVLSYGAIGDGVQDDTQAFLQAWGDACSATGGSATLTVPAGKTFLVNAVSFKGPCNSSSIQFQIQGTITAPDNIDAWDLCEDNAWLHFAYINNLRLNGNGLIDGKGSAWWNNIAETKASAPYDQGDVGGQGSISRLHANVYGRGEVDGNDSILPERADGSKRACQRPTALRLESCEGLQLEGLTHKDSPGNHITCDGCNNGTISNIHITAPGDSPNTDGIDISSTSYLQIRDSFIATGDDCVAIESNSQWINVTGVTCGPGHGISVGSLGRDGSHDEVEEIHIRNCTFNKSTNGARIKSWQGGSGYARKISYDDIIIQDVDNPIIIDQFYCLASEHCSTEPSAVAVSDVRFTGFEGTSTGATAITLNCSQTIPCTGIVMSMINLTSSGQAVSSACANVKGQSSSVVPQVPCLDNVVVRRPFFFGI